MRSGDAELPSARRRSTNSARISPKHVYFDSPGGRNTRGQKRAVEASIEYRGRGCCVIDGLLSRESWP